VDARVVAHYHACAPVDERPHLLRGRLRPHGQFGPANLVAGPHATNTFGARERVGDAVALQLVCFSFGHRT
jgi:hypothetical protein